MIQPLLTGRGAGAGFRFRGPHSVNGVLTRAGRDGVTGRVALSPRRCGASSSASALAEIRDTAPAGAFLLGQGNAHLSAKPAADRRPPSWETQGGSAIPP